MCGCLLRALYWGPDLDGNPEIRPLTGNRTNNPVVCRPVLHPLSHTSQGTFRYFINQIINDINKHREYLTNSCKKYSYWPSITGLRRTETGDEGAQYRLNSHTDTERAATKVVNRAIERGSEETPPGEDCATSTSLSAALRGRGLWGCRLPTRRGSPGRP